MIRTGIVSKTALLGQKTCYRTGQLCIAQFDLVVFTTSDLSPRCLHLATSLTRSL